MHFVGVNTALWEGNIKKKERGGYDIKSFPNPANDLPEAIVHTSQLRSSSNSFKASLAKTTPHL